MMIKVSEVDNRFRLSYEVHKDKLYFRDFLAEKEISSRTLAAIKYGGGKLLVNGDEQNVRYILNKHDKVDVIFPPEELSPGLKPETGVLDIVYEDEAILILNKSAAQSTIPSRNHQSGTIANFVAGKFIRERISATVHIVTRLDHDTSGLLCIAKNRHIHHLLGKQMMNAQFNRQYEAVVEGHITKDFFTINEPIGRKEDSIIERIVCEDGQQALTDVFVTGRFVHAGRPLTKVRLVLHTGRTHQIRVHMKWAGFPLAGDDLYDGSRVLINRQALHCTLLKFKHPITGEIVVFKSKLPIDMENILK